ncbi:MAG: hypothetical protein IT164_08820, partial [Bryobacterales bacterium]|nr:hypothetical protein [Bryobacterales bacterium]
TRYRLNALAPIPQMGGTFESGLADRRPVDFLYRARTSARSKPGAEGRDSALLLAALGVEDVAVHTPDSSEYFRDTRLPEKFEGLLPRVHGDRGDRIYRLPYSGLAHLIDPSESVTESPLAAGPPALRRYLAAIHDPKRPPPPLYWPSRSRMELHTPVSRPQLLSVQFNYHPGWRVTQDGKPVPTSADQLGFLLARLEPAAHSHVVLQFQATRETRLFGWLSLLAWTLSLSLCARALWRARRPQGV